MTESNLKEMMIDDIDGEAEEETPQAESQQKLEWYLIDTDRTFCKVWNLLITILTIYTLFVTPFVVVFPTVYEWCETTNNDLIEFDECPEGEDSPGWKKNQTLFKIELAMDIIYFIEILMNFVKKSRAHKDLQAIANNYLFGYFLFDVVATIPCLFMSEPIKFYLLKGFRIVHGARLTVPLQLVLGCALQNIQRRDKMIFQALLD